MYMIKFIIIIKIEKILINNEKIFNKYEIYLNMLKIEVK